MSVYSLTIFLKFQLLWSNFDHWIDTSILKIIRQNKYRKTYSFINTKPIVMKFGTGKYVVIIDKL